MTISAVTARGVQHCLVAGLQMIVRAVEYVLYEDRGDIRAGTDPYTGTLRAVFQNDPYRSRGFLAV